MRQNIEALEDKLGFGAKVEQFILPNFYLNCVSKRFIASHFAQSMVPPYPNRESYTIN